MVVAMKSLPVAVSPCEWCGRETERGARWCGDACRSSRWRAYRRLRWFIVEGVEVVDGEHEPRWLDNVPRAFGGRLLDEVAKAAEGTRAAWFIRQASTWGQAGAGRLVDPGAWRLLRALVGLDGPAADDVRKAFARGGHATMVGA